MLKSPPPAAPEPTRIRLTISVPVEVHAVFHRMAKASGMSLGAAMGDWLGDTIEAAEMMTAMTERARQAPKQVLRELNALALGYSDETGAALLAARKTSAAAAALRAAEPRPGGRREAGSPPSSNTGGYSSKSPPPKRRQK